MNETAKDLLEEINTAKAQLAVLKNQYASKNSGPLVKAILDLKEGLDVEEADYYAPKRKYVKDIPGVKNIRYKYNLDKDVPTIIVKVTSPAGKLLPETVEVDGTEVWESNSYTENLDY